MPFKKGNLLCLGRICSENTRLKISSSAIGKPHTKRLPDNIAACNMIKRQRKEHKKCKHKAIWVRLNGEGNLLARTDIHIRMTTNIISMTHSLGYRRVLFYPTTHQKLKCTNQHALDMLLKERERYKLRRKWNKER